MQVVGSSERSAQIDMRCRCFAFALLPLGLGFQGSYTVAAGLKDCWCVYRL